MAQPAAVVTCSRDRVLVVAGLDLDRRRVSELLVMSVVVVVMVMVLLLLMWLVLLVLVW